MTLQQAFDDFIFSRKIEGCTDKTIECYESFCKPFGEYLGHDIDISSINKTMINAYIKTLYDRPISRSTLSTYVRHIKIFLTYIEKENAIDMQAEKIKVPKMPKKVLHIYNDEEIILIFQSVTTSIDWITARNQCIIALMLDSGFRQNEICKLQRIDINRQTHTMKILGKGNKERVLPYGRIAQHYMELYDKLCPFKEKCFFVNRRGEPLTNNAIKQFIQKISVNLPFPFSSHKLRHNFATNYCINQLEQRGQVDIYSLMILMGHEDVQTTERYLHFARQIVASKNTISHLDKVLLS